MRTNQFSKWSSIIFWLIWFILLLCPGPVQAESDTVVSVSVTIQNISITIPDGWPVAVNYGVVALDNEITPASYSPSTQNYLRVVNNGSIPVDIYIKGFNATYGTHSWTLADDNGPDTYVHYYGPGQTPLSYTALDITGQLLSSNVAIEQAVDFNLKIESPTSTTGYGEYNTNVTLVATGL